MSDHLAERQPCACLQRLPADDVHALRGEHVPARVQPHTECDRGRGRGVRIRVCASAFRALRAVEHPILGVDGPSPLVPPQVLPAAATSRRLRHGGVHVRAGAVLRLLLGVLLYAAACGVGRVCVAGPRAEIAAQSTGRARLFPSACSQPAALLRALPGAHKASGLRPNSRGQHSRVRRSIALLFSVADAQHLAEAGVVFRGTRVPGGLRSCLCMHRRSLRSAMQRRGRAAPHDRVSCMGRSRVGAVARPGRACRRTRTMPRAILAAAQVRARLRRGPRASASCHARDHCGLRCRRVRRPCAPEVAARLAAASRAGFRPCASGSRERTRAPPDG